MGDARVHPRNMRLPDPALRVVGDLVTQRDEHWWWDTSVRFALDEIRRDLRGPYAILGEGDRSVSLLAALKGRPVAVKIMFSESDWRTAKAVRGKMLRGIASVLWVSEWMRDYGVAIQERAWTPHQLLAQVDPPFASSEISRLIDATDWVGEEEDRADVGDDRFVEDLEGGLENLSRYRGIGEGGVDVHGGNTGLVRRDGATQAVLVDLGSVY